MKFVDECWGEQLIELVDCAAEVHELGCRASHDLEFAAALDDMRDLLAELLAQSGQRFDVGPHDGHIGVQQTLSLIDDHSHRLKMLLEDLGAVLNVLEFVVRERLCHSILTEMR